ncbi:MAG: NAD-dependent epimerase/dehydratase family protein [Actinobacteria bacterium]|nr:NAD-dependent epimerase/dehydratase family protein [Actinomycetota bacterium]
MTDRVFMTGASGFLGRAICTRLVEQERDVIALARSDDAAKVVTGLGARVHRGDILDDDSLSGAMEGCGVVYHVAGVNAFCLADPAPLYRGNVLGSHNVVAAAHQAGVTRMVYTSSAATIGEPKGTIGSETSAHRGFWLSQYERSKFEAEAAVFLTADRAGIDVVSVNPASVQGPGRTSGTARLLIDYANGQLKVALDTTMSIVDVADCAQGHILAETHGAPGARYILSGATLKVSEAIALMAEITGINNSPVMLPSIAARAAAYGTEIWGRLQRRNPSYCREVISTLLHGHAYDASLSQRELGLVYAPVETSVATTVAWYRSEGFIA